MDSDNPAQLSQEDIDAGRHYREVIDRYKNGFPTSEQLFGEDWRDKAVFTDANAYVESRGWGKFTSMQRIERDAVAAIEDDNVRELCEHMFAEGTDLDGIAIANFGEEDDLRRKQILMIERSIQDEDGEHYIFMTEMVDVRRVDVNWIGRRKDMKGCIYFPYDIVLHRGYERGLPPAYLSLKLLGRPGETVRFDISELLQKRGMEEDVRNSINDSSFSKQGIIINAPIVRTKSDLYGLLHEFGHHAMATFDPEFEAAEQEALRIVRRGEEVLGLTAHMARELIAQDENAAWKVARHISDMLRVTLQSGARLSEIADFQDDADAHLATYDEKFASDVDTPWPAAFAGINHKLRQITKDLGVLLIEDPYTGEKINTLPFKQLLEAHVDPHIVGEKLRELGSADTEADQVVQAMDAIHILHNMGQEKMEDQLKETA